MTDAARKFDDLAHGYTERTYADPERVHERRARLVVELGTRLGRGERVLDLGCGDAYLGPRLLAAGLDYTGVDASPGMVAAAAERVGAGRIALGDLETYRPPEDVAATTCFNAIRYVSDLGALFRNVAGYTTKKVVFDLSARELSVENAREAAAAAGFPSFDVRPFFVPQSRRLPRAAAAALEAAERVPPLARLALRARFMVVCAASR